MRQKREPVFVHLFNTWQKLVSSFHIHQGKYKLQFRIFNFWHAVRILQCQWHWTFYAYQSSKLFDDYRLVFIVSVSLLFNILNAGQSYIYRIVAYTFTDVCKKKSHTVRYILCQVLKRCTYFCLTVQNCRICIIVMVWRRQNRYNADTQGVSTFGSFVVITAMKYFLK